MYALKQRSASDGVVFHSVIGPRVYDECPTHRDRIERSRAYVQQCVVDLEKKRCSIVELGCGTADISGPLSAENDVVGVDCNEASLAVAKSRFPNLITLRRPIDELEPIQCDVLVLCETLEHLADPLTLVRRWLPLANMAVISHPLDEPVNSVLSGGEHQWGFSELDLASWFNVGDMRITDEVSYQMGCYQMIMGRGRKKP